MLYKQKNLDLRLMSLPDKEFVKIIESGCIKSFLETFYQVMSHETHKGEGKYYIFGAVFIFPSN